MKKITSLIVIAIVSILAIAPASAQIKFGLKAGVAVNSLKFNSDGVKETFDASNRAGFTGGAMLEFTVPVIGVGFDLSAMYVHRSAGNLDNTVVKTSRDYIDIPLNVKWKINIPVVSKVLKPYLTTGPAFAFLVSKEAAGEFFKNKKSDISWNFGVGIELLSHVQVGASYGIGLTKALETVNLVNDMPTIDGKNKYWTITAAYLF